MRRVQAGFEWNLDIRRAERHARGRTALRPNARLTSPGSCGGCSCSTLSLPHVQLARCRMYVADDMRLPEYFMLCQIASVQLARQDAVSEPQIAAQLAAAMKHLSLVYSPPFPGRARLVKCRSRHTPLQLSKALRTLPGKSYGSDSGPAPLWSSCQTS